MPSKKPRKTFTYEGERYDVTASSKEELIIKVHEKKKALKDGSIVINDSTLVKRWAEEWVDTYKKNSVSQETYKSYKYVIDKYITPSIGKLRIRDVKPLQLQKILLGMDGMSKDHISKVHYTIVQIFKSAVENSLIATNPAANLSEPKGTSGSRRALTEAEREYVLALAETHRAGLWVKLMLYCGLRPAEAAALQWRHVDFKKAILKIEQATKRSGGVGEPKTASGNRMIPIPAEMLNALSAAKGEPYSYILTNTKGGRLTATSMQRMWDYFKNELNIRLGCGSYKGRAVPPFRVAPDLVPYCFRHTYCTDLQSAGVPINVAKELMGHSSIEVTAKIYTHHSVVAFDAAAEAINKLHEKLSKKADEKELSHTNSHIL